jgi:alkanesulfonate monooxygenase SsuD/methylene tetrahydromethanopterin reductase-like flavin-dependent oxidoreductase (luciferase family)
MTDIPDQTIDNSKSPILGSPHAFKLACFSANIGGGLLMTDVDGPPKAVWLEQVRIAQLADRVGFDALVPLARWRGHGGRTNPQHRTFETFTWAAGLAAVTERINVFSTVHVPTIHPIMAAKMGATIDHISHGRFGLNVVAGWNPDELAMFGVDKRDHDERYAVADEWIRVVKQLWGRKGGSPFRGEYFDIESAFSEPKPVQRPHPPIMSAGVSPAGQAFATSHSDMIFMSVGQPSETADKVAAIKARARERHGRDVKVFGVGYVTCADTDEEAQAEYRRVILEHADWDAAKSAIAKIMAHSQTIDYESSETQALLESLLRAFFSNPLTGSPETIVRQIKEFADVGLEGMAVSWSDFEHGLERFEQDLLPLMIDAGLRVPNEVRAMTAAVAS